MDLVMLKIKKALRRERFFCVVVSSLIVREENTFEVHCECLGVISEGER